MVATTRLFLLWNLGDQRFSGQQQAGDAGRILQSSLNYLGRVDHALGNKVGVLATVGIEAFRLALEIAHAVYDHSAFITGIFCDAAERILQYLANDPHASLLVVRQALETVEGLLGPNQGDATAGNNPFRQSRRSRALGIIQQVLAFLHFGFGCRAHTDLSHATSQLGQPLLQLLAVVITLHRFDFTADLGDPSFDVILLAGSSDHHGLIRGDPQLLDPPQVGQLNAFQVDAAVLENRVGTGQHRDVAQNRLAAVTITGSLHSNHLQNAPHLVDDQSRQGLAVDILSNDQQLLLGLADCLQQRNQRFVGRDLLFVNQNMAVIHLNRNFVLVGDKVRREKPAIKLHAFDDFHRRLAATPLFNRDHAILANLEKRIRQNIANRRIIVARDRGDLLDFLFALGVNRLGLLGNLVANRRDCLADPPRQCHRVKARSDHLQALAENPFRQHRRSRGAVTSHIVGLAGCFLDELHTEVFVRIIQLDVLSHRDTVFGHLGTAPAFVENRVATARAQRAAHSPSQLADTGQQRLPRRIVKYHLLRTHRNPPLTNLKCACFVPCLSSCRAYLRAVLNFVIVPIRPTGRDDHGFNEPVPCGARCLDRAKKRPQR